MNYTQILERTLDNDEVDFNLDALRLKVEVATGASMPVLLRSEAKRPLTAAEMDNNFQSLDLAVQQALYGDGPKPSLDLRFSGAKFLDPRISFTRASKATYWGADGKLHEAGVNEPRFEYDPQTGEALGLLVEGQATNLHKYSALFDNAAWVKSAASITANARRAPDGTLTASKLVESAANAQHFIHQSFPLVTGAKYTHSIFAWHGERTVIRLDAADVGVGAKNYAVFDLAAGTCMEVGNVTADMEPLGDGGFRLWCTSTAIADVSTPFGIYLGGTGDNYTGDGTSGVYIWGSQLEVGDSPTSYIPTEGSQVTRAADLATMPIGEEWNQNEGTVFVDIPLGVSENNSNAVLWSASNGFTFTDSFYIVLVGANKTLVVSGSNTLFDDIALKSDYSGGSIRVAISFKNGSEVAASYNGEPVVTKPILKDFVFDHFSVLSNSWSASGSNYSNTTVGKFTYIPRALTDAQLQELTS